MFRDKGTKKYEIFCTETILTHIPLHKSKISKQWQSSTWPSWYRSPVTCTLACTWLQGILGSVC